MSNQKVFRLPSKGAGYEAIQESSEPIPKPQAHEVVIKIHATVRVTMPPKTPIINLKC